jgi:hypothetical protein
MTEQQEQAIRQAVADIFLTKGTYEDLQRLADGTRPHGEVWVWQEFEHWAYDDLLEQVDNAITNIINSIKNTAP